MADIKCQNYIHKYKCLEYVLDHNACMECDRRVINPVIEELEKIKEEIEKLNNTDYGSMFSYEAHQGAGYMQDDIINIIERHITELKGE